MICTCIQHKSYEEIVGILGTVEMAEIRLDRCPLSDDEIRDLFENSDTPLVATCRIAEAGVQETERLLRLAIESGARLADLEVDAPARLSKYFQKLCRECGTELIRSYHDFEGTPDDEQLQKALARCFRYGADIAKIVTTCRSAGDAARLEALYGIVLEGVDSLEGRLIAFGMGPEGRESRIGCIRRGAPFTYACLEEGDEVADGQWTTDEMSKRIYGPLKRYDRTALRMPASKSFAQRAIIAAALAEGTSRLSGYTPCDDSEAAIALALRLGADVCREDDTLVIKGAAPKAGSLTLESIDAGESGLLARLMIPVMSVLSADPFTVTGRGTLPSRPLGEAAGIMAAFGVMLSNAEKRDSREVYVPVRVRGALIPGTADVSGKAGSQLISGLLAALPLCAKDSTVYVSEPRSIPYMYMTLDVLRHFGIRTRSEMEGDAEMLEQQDWSYCTGITFSTKGGQKYRATGLAIEPDWSAAANFLVAGAIFGSVEIEGLDMQSLQADLTVTDILVEAGAVVSQLEDPASVCVRKAPLEAFTTDLNNAPDLFPIISVLAAFCAGESRIAGIGRLAAKESNRAEAILEMLHDFGVEAEIQDDILSVCGETLACRALSGRLLKGGKFSSHHDHRMVMALSVAALGADSPVDIDDTRCVAKSFPGFFELI